MATFEELYSKYLVDEYGKSFFKYTLACIASIILFLTSIIVLFIYTDDPNDGKS